MLGNLGMAVVGTLGMAGTLGIQGTAGMVQYLRMVIRKDCKKVRDQQEVLEDRNANRNANRNMKTTSNVLVYWFFVEKVFWLVCLLAGQMVAVSEREKVWG